MWKVLAELFIKGASMLLDLGHKPSRDDAIDIAKALLKDEFMARVVADEIDAKLNAAIAGAEKVRGAFRPDGSVPDLLDSLDGSVVLICPEPGCSKRLDHEKSGDPEHGVDL